MNDFGKDFAGFRMVGSVLFSHGVPKGGLFRGAVVPLFDEIATGKFHVFLGESGFGNGKDVQGGIVTLDVRIGGKRLLFIFG